MEPGGETYKTVYTQLFDTYSQYCELWVKYFLCKVAILISQKAVMKAIGRKKLTTVLTSINPAACREKKLFFPFSATVIIYLYLY